LVVLHIQSSGREKPQSRKTPVIRRCGASKAGRRKMGTTTVCWPEEELL
jgi:hypothetical protein